MKKNTKTEVEKFYKESDNAKVYDKKRFPKSGGRYVNNNEIAPVVLLVNKIDKKKFTILDLGAGRGRLSKRLAKLGHEVYCLDTSIEMTKYLGKSFDRKHVFLQSVFDPINSDKRFDVVTSLRFFDHFNIIDQSKILKNIKKNLNKHGHVVFASLNKFSIESLLSTLFYYGKCNYFYSDAEYRFMFNKMGFEVLEMEGRFFFPRGMIVRTNSVLFVQKLLIKLDLTFCRLLPRWCAFNTYLLKRK